MNWKKLLISACLPIFLLLLNPFAIVAGSNKLERSVDKLRFKTHVYYPKEKNKANSLISCDPTTTDPSSFGLTGWQLPQTVHYRINKAEAPSSVRSIFQTVVTNSFQTWSAASSGKVNFVYDGTTSLRRAKLDGQNTITWARLNGSSLGITYTWYYPDTGQVVDVDTVMNKKYNWSWTNPNSINVETSCSQTNTFDVQNILTHEFGHWMGLDDLYSSSVKDLTMFGYASPGELKKDLPASGDLLGINSLYP